MFGKSLTLFFNSVSTLILTLALKSKREKLELCHELFTRIKLRHQVLINIYIVLALTSFSLQGLDDRVLSKAALAPAVPLHSAY